MLPLSSRPSLASLVKGKGTQSCPQGGAEAPVQTQDLEGSATSCSQSPGLGGSEQTQDPKP